MTRGTNKEEAEQLALAAPKVQSHLEGRQIRKVIVVVPGTSGEYSQWLINDWNSLITDTKSTVFNTVNFPVKVIAGSMDRQRLLKH